jgi:hypothetical protein
MRQPQKKITVKQMHSRMIAEIRKNRPEFSTLSDEQIADHLLEKALFDELRRLPQMEVIPQYRQNAELRNYVGVPSRVQAYHQWQLTGKSRIRSGLPYKRLKRTPENERQIVKGVLNCAFVEVPDENPSTK